MTKLGGCLVFFAIGSAILSATSHQFRLMMWMDALGSGAWLARAAMITAGAVLIGIRAVRPRTPAAARPMPTPAPQDFIRRF